MRVRKSALIFKSFLVGFSALVLACNKIETGKSLQKKDVERLRSFQLLDEGETIFAFYSEYKNEVAGNFYTDKRIASYWIDAENKSTTKRVFAYYRQIKSIDTVMYAGATYCPYLRVTKHDNTTFDVYFDGKPELVRAAFQEAIGIWLTHKQPQ